MTELKRFSVGYMPTDCYVLTGTEDGAVIVDPGGGYGKICAYLESIGKKPVAVLLTHGHFDHIADVFKWYSDGATVYIGVSDADCLVSNDASMAEKFGLMYPAIPKFEKITDGQVLKFGDIELTVMSSPGHSPGSVCYFLDGKRILTGDTLFFESYGRTDFPGGDTESLKTSVKRLFALEGDYALYPGHGESTTLDYERDKNPINDLL